MKRKIKPGLTNADMSCYGLCGECGESNPLPYQRRKGKYLISRYCEDCATEPVGDGMCWECGWDNGEHFGACRKLKTTTQGLYREDYEKEDRPSYGCDYSGKEWDCSREASYRGKKIQTPNWLCEKHWKELPSKRVFSSPGGPNWFYDEYVSQVANLQHWREEQSPSRNLSTNLKEKAMSVSRKLKQLTKSSDTKLLEKYGVIDECGDLTEEGGSIVVDKVFESVKADIVADLKKVEQEEKKK